MKVAINRCWGGFGLSKEAYEFLGLEWDGFGYAYSPDEKRTDPALIECIEKIGSEKASGHFASVEVVEIPDDVDWYIDEYDGMETVEEKHRSWC